MTPELLVYLILCATLAIGFPLAALHYVRTAIMCGMHWYFVLALVFFLVGLMFLGLSFLLLERLTT